MKDVLSYKDYIASVHFNAHDEVFYGSVEGIDDLITFEGSSVTELRRAFEEAIDDYLELCKTHGKAIEKSYKGSFNVRVTPEIHKKAKRIAQVQGLSLNQFVQRALEDEVRKIEVGV